MFTRQGLSACISCLFALQVGSLAPVAALAQAAPARPPAPAPQGTGPWAVAVDRAFERLGLGAIAEARALEGAAQERLARSVFAGPIEADAGVRQDALGSGYGYRETEIGLMEKVGEQNYLQTQIGGGKDS